MYRAATWIVGQSGVDASDQALVAKLISGANFRIRTDPQSPQFVVNDADVTQAIRDSEISGQVSAVAANPEVRRLLIAQQRQLIDAAEHGIVVEGRDISTVVAPDATVRVLLVADSRARAARRATELGNGTDERSVHDQLTRRDEDDSTVSEFWDAAPGVVVVDSTDQTLAEVADQICELVDGAREAPADGGPVDTGPVDTGPVDTGVVDTGGQRHR